VTATATATDGSSTDGSPRDRAVEAVRALARASSALQRVSGEMSLAHYRVLSAVASGDERASRIARKLAVGKPTVSAAVEALSQRGLLARRTSVDDQRAAELHLTAEGVALLDRVETAMVARLDDLAARTPDAGALIDALTWLGAALDARVTAREAAGSPAGPPDGRMAVAGAVAAPDGRR
jgi:DNA-binding MarR family transcriptional regulator